MDELGDPIAGIAYATCAGKQIVVTVKQAMSGSHS